MYCLRDNTTAQPKSRSKMNLDTTVAQIQVHSAQFTKNITSLHFRYIYIYIYIKVIYFL